MWFHALQARWRKWFQPIAVPVTRLYPKRGKLLVVKTTEQLTWQKRFHSWMWMRAMVTKEKAFLARKLFGRGL